MSYIHFRKEFRPKKFLRSFSQNRNEIEKFTFLKNTLRKGEIMKMLTMIILYIKKVRNNSVFQKKNQKTIFLEFLKIFEN